MENSITVRIFEIIERLNLNQTKLSQVLGITKSNLSEWKTGRGEPSPKVILKFLYYFPEVDANWLIRGKGIEPAAGQSVTGSANTVAQGGSKMMGNVFANAAADVEINYLKAIIKEKEEQITLLKTVLNKNN